MYCPFHLHETIKIKNRAAITSILDHKFWEMTILNCSIFILHMYMDVYVILWNYKICNYI